jgi:hypothetical protein
MRNAVGKPRMWPMLKGDKAKSSFDIDMIMPEFVINSGTQSLPLVLFLVYLSGSQTNPFSFQSVEALS